MSKRDRGKLIRELISSCLFFIIWEWLVNHIQHSTNCWSSNVSRFTLHHKRYDRKYLSQIKRSNSVLELLEYRVPSSIHGFYESRFENELRHKIFETSDTENLHLGLDKVRTYVRDICWRQFRSFGFKNVHIYNFNPMSRERYVPVLV